MNEQNFEFSETEIEDFKAGRVPIDKVVELYNPMNASTLPLPAISLMQHLNGDQIKALAEAYPNRATGNAYLVLFDNDLKGKQLMPRSTWGNLHNLRKLTGRSNMVAFGFASRVNYKQQVKPVRSEGGSEDISVEEIAKHGGLSMATPQAGKATDQIPQQQTGGTVTAAPIPENNTLQAGATDALKTAENAQSEGLGATDNFEDLKVPGTEDIKQEETTSTTSADGAASSFVKPEETTEEKKK